MKKTDENKRMNSVVEYIKEHGFITRSSAAKLMGLGKSRASDILLIMIDDKLIGKKGAGRSTKYVLSEDED